MTIYDKMERRNNIIYLDLEEDVTVSGRNVRNSPLFRHVQDSNDIHSVCYPFVLLFIVLLKLPAQFQIRFIIYMIM